MIDRLSVADFQCHRRLRVDLDPSVTTFVGPSDAGKSTILRALRWLALNKPRGDGFIRDGARRTTVMLDVDDERIGRRKGGGENLYRLGKAVYRSFRDGVPEQIERLLNLADVNFQGQHDPPFWFCLTAGELARELNAIVDLSLIDEVLGELASRLRKARAEAEVVESRLAEARAEVGRLGFVPRADGDLKRAEGLAAEAGRIRDGAARLAALVGDGRDMGARAGRLREAVLAGEGAVSLGSAAVEVSEAAGLLAGMLDAVRAAKAAAGRKVPDMSELDRLAERCRATCDGTIALRALVEKAAAASDRAGRSANDFRAAVEELDEAVEGRCPLCGAKMQNT